MNQIDYLQLLRLAAPEAVLTATLLSVLAVDLMVLRGIEMRARVVITCLIAATGCVITMGALLGVPEYGNFAAGMLRADPLASLVKAAVVALTLFTVLLALWDGVPLEDPGEYFAIILGGTIGMMLLVSAEQLLMVFLSLEISSLSLYILAAFNKRSARSAESGLKYFLFGGISAAFLLFGFSLLYGLTGTVNLTEIGQAASRVGRDPLLMVALVMVAIGFAFKVAVVPYHLWAPEVYQGAPVPSAALIASGSKVASFFIFAKVMVVGFGTKSPDPTGAVTGWVMVIAVMAAASMILGNAAALVQGSVKRLLAFSAVAHAGYMLLGILSGAEGIASLVYYSVTYGLATVGAFAVVSVVQAETGGDRLSDFAGLSRRHPLMAFCMLVFVLSLAGIPPLAGFFGKFYIFAAATKSGFLWLVILAIAASAVSLYYYLVVMKEIYVREKSAGQSGECGIPGMATVVGALALLVLLFGCFPDLLLKPLAGAILRVGL